MELRSLLSKQKQRRFNPEQKLKEWVDIGQNQTLKRCQSALSIRRKGNKNEIYELETRYRLLEQNYQKILEQTRTRTAQYQRQKDQVQKLKMRQLKDKKQIERLRSMLGFLQKKDQCCQTISNDLQRTSCHTKIEKSTVSDFLDTGSLWSQKPNRTQCKNVITPSKRNFLNQSNIKSPRKTKSPTNRYKFIPTLPLQR